VQRRWLAFVALISPFIAGLVVGVLIPAVGGSASAAVALDSGSDASTAKIVFVDVGQGDGVAMRIGGKIIVSDAGFPVKAGQMHKALEALNANGHIDVAILSHGHNDHVGGFSKLVSKHGYEVDLVIAAPNGKWETDANQTVLNVLRGAGATIDWVRRGNSFDWGGASWTILNPEQGSFTATSNVENASVVTLLEVNGRRVLFTGDIKEKATEQLEASWGDRGQAHIFLVTHHGSKFGSSDDLLKKIQPRFAVISVGATNTFTHPSPETVDRLRAAEVNTERIYCTVANGTVTATISTSGAISWKTAPGEQAVPWWSRAGGQAGICKGRK
jgi:competence protein ComEC